MGSYIPDCSHYWRPPWQKVELVPGPSKALRRNNSMDFEPAMNENGVLDKFKILRRITLMDFEAAIVE
jgi:hypothetical protein